MSDAFKSFRCCAGFSSPPSDDGATAQEGFDPPEVEPEQSRDAAGSDKDGRLHLRTARLKSSGFES
ncbi:hypothetical protein [Aquicoccus sp. SU-CL01552]|uniref:hypothetical protein n=1 Tax=Aquicoccus sp. SU-CL01552 TaxID=3127656 RepID=UPI0031074C91